MPNALINIKIKHPLTWLLVVIFAFMPIAALHSQENQRNPSRQAAIDAYLNGEYEKAINEFNLLLQKYSKDPLYNYYMGVCLVKMNRYPENASAYLREALNGSLDIKNIPDDVWFYLGRSQQMAGKYQDAIKSYDNFEVKAGKKTAREFKLSDYIQECNEGRGRIKDPEYRAIEFITKTDVIAIEAGQSANDTKAVNQQSVTKPVPRKEDIPLEFDKVLSLAMDYQVKADSLNVLITEYRRQIKDLTPSQQQAARSRVAEMESLSAEYQRMADEKFGNSVPGPIVRKETVPDPVLPDVSTKQEIYSLFSVENDPMRFRVQKIELDPELPAGLVYRIQMGVFNKIPEPSFFKGISPVSGFKIPGSESTRFFAGLFRRSADANRSLVTVKQMGFKDSFITAVLDGKAVSTDRALLMEKEWSQVPLKVVTPAREAVVKEPSTLTFRVEVTRSAKPVGDDITETYKKMAGNRGFEIVQGDAGTFVYLIGKFITFESASEYADLLKRNGYQDAKVSAYLGIREIPIETAKQIFEK